MTGSPTAKAIDGTLVSASDRARIEAEERMHEQWQRRTVRVVAGAAHDAADCRMLLSILGLTPEVVGAARAERPATTARKRPATKPRKRPAHTAA